VGLQTWKLAIIITLPESRTGTLDVVQKHLCKKMQQTNISFELISSTHWMECNLKMCQKKFRYEQGQNKGLDEEVT
jgi:hypothetical protein